MTKKEHKQQLLNDLYAPYQSCTLCPLNQGRANIVFGEGNPDAKMMLIGEGPGKEEDLQGRPFVGRSGKILTKILENIGIKREEVFIANVVKCRPPNNRTPLAYEVTTCKNILLEKQIEIVQPKVICTLGSSALNALLSDTSSISKCRGVFIPYNKSKLLPTFHPAYILRNRSKMPLFVSDIQKGFNYIKK